MIRSIVYVRSPSLHEEATQNLQTIMLVGVGPAGGRRASIPMTLGEARQLRDRLDQALTFIDAHPVCLTPGVFGDSPISVRYLGRHDTISGSDRP